MKKPNIVFERIRPRWMIRRDLVAIEAIEAATFANPWTAEDFCRRLRKLDSIGQVVEIDERVAAYCLYVLTPVAIRLLRIATDRRWRRHGAATAMVDRLKKKLSSNRRHWIRADVPETRLPAQLFLRSQGFRAIQCLPDAVPEPTYRFEFALPESNP